MGAEKEGIIEFADGVVAGGVVKIGGFGDGVPILLEKPSIETDLAHVGFMVFCVWV